MVLCFDVGNTDIDAGAFENDKFYKAFNIDYKKGQSVEEYKKGIKKALVPIIGTRASLLRYHPVSSALHGRAFSAHQHARSLDNGWRSRRP